MKFKNDFMPHCAEVRRTLLEKRLLRGTTMQSDNNGRWQLCLRSFRAYRVQVVTNVELQDLSGSEVRTSFISSFNTSSGSRLTLNTSSILKYSSSEWWFILQYWFCKSLGQRFVLQTIWTIPLLIFPKQIDTSCPALMSIFGNNWK